MLATPNECLPRLMRNEDLARAEALRLLDWLLDGSATDAQIAATLIALKRKGETVEELAGLAQGMRAHATRIRDRKSTRLNSSHRTISYAVFCLKKKKKNNKSTENYTHHNK